jgi:hypothetical protein
MKLNMQGVEVTHSAGLFPGLQKMPWQQDLLSKLIVDYQFEEEYAVRCMEANRHNHITATYHLIDKKNQRNRYMRETFSTHNKKETELKRDRLQSQGAPKSKQNAIELNEVKPPARKFAEDEKMNQTMRSPEIKSDVVEGTRRAATLDIHDEVKKVSLSPQIGKVEIVKLRGNNKPSVSPDKYIINPNLVVNLQDQIKKPQEVQIRMNQTTYVKGGKANFFPSTATATTNGSSGNGSSDPRRTTETGTRKPSISS